MEDSTKSQLQMGAGAGLAAAGAGLGYGLPRLADRGVQQAQGQLQAAEQAVHAHRANLPLPAPYQQATDELNQLAAHRDSFKPIIRDVRSGVVSIPDAAFDALHAQQSAAAAAHARQSDALSAVTNAWRGAQPVPAELTGAAEHAAQRAEAAGQRALQVGRGARVLGGGLALGGLALGAKGLYDRFHEPPSMTRTASHLGALSALRALGLQKHANLPAEAAQLFSTKLGPSKLELAVARAKNSLHAGQLGAGRIRSLAMQGFEPGSPQQYALMSGWTPSSVVRPDFTNRFVEALR